MSYAIFTTGGAQFRAEPGGTIKVPLLEAEPGSKETVHRGHDHRPAARHEVPSRDERPPRVRRLAVHRRGRAGQVRAQKQEAVPGERLSTAGNRELTAAPPEESRRRGISRPPLSFVAPAQRLRGRPILSPLG